MSIETIDREAERLEFIRRRDGLEAAIEFAKRGIRVYRQAVLKIKGHVHKQGMVMSYVYYKKHLRKIAAETRKVTH